MQTRLKGRRTVLEFVRLAEAYCRLIERARDFPRKKFIEEIGKILPPLYATTDALPRAKPTESKVPSGHLSNSEWMSLFHYLHRKLGSWDEYSHVFDPTKDKEAIIQWLSDDISDIYRELHNFLIDVSHGISFRHALWEVKYMFGCHWGQHLTNAIRVVHELRFRDD